MSLLTLQVLGVITVNGASDNLLRRKLIQLFLTMSIICFYYEWLGEFVSKSSGVEGVYLNKIWTTLSVAGKTIYKHYFQNINVPWKSSTIYLVKYPIGF